MNKFIFAIFLFVFTITDLFSPVFSAPTPVSIAKNPESRRSQPSHRHHAKKSKTFIWLSDVHLEPRYNPNIGPATFCMPNNTFSALLDREYSIKRPYRNRGYVSELPVPPLGLAPFSRGEISPNLYYAPTTTLIPSSSDDAQVEYGSYRQQRGGRAKLFPGAGAESEQALSEQGVAHYKWGQFGCDAPPDLVESALDDMKHREPDPEFILL